MAYTPLQNSFRIVTIAHSSNIPDPIGGAVDEQIGVAENRPGTRLSPASTIDTYNVTAVGRGSMRFTPIVRGTVSTLTFTVLEYDGTTSGTVVVVTMRAGEYHADLNSKPHTHEQRFFYDAGNTENLAPISFS